MWVGRLCVFLTKEQYTVCMLMWSNFIIYLCFKCTYDLFKSVFTHVLSQVCLQCVLPSFFNALDPELSHSVLGEQFLIALKSSWWFHISETP